jgi:hypothetical protein
VDRNPQIKGVNRFNAEKTLKREKLPLQRGNELPSWRANINLEKENSLIEEVNLN